MYLFTYILADCLNLDNQNQEIIKWVLEARATGKTIKVRYGKVLLSGSSAAGKTSFFRLLMKKGFEHQYTSTGLADSHRITITKVYLKSSSSDKEVEFKELDFKSEISQLKSHLCSKSHLGDSNATTSLDSDTTLQTIESTITEIENVMVTDSETDQIPMQFSQSSDSEVIWDILTFVDTGGQPEYISMLPAVNSTVMVTFVVHKMEGGTKTLYSPVTVVHDKHKPYPLGQTNLDLIKTLMSFTNNTLLHKKPFLDDVCCKKGNSVSYLSFIGTHYDKVSYNDVGKIDEVLRGTVIDSGTKDVLTQLNSDFTHLIPVDNTTAGQTNEDKSATKIRQNIYQLLQEQDVYDVPYNWLVLELEIRNVCKKRGCTFITYNKVLELTNEKGLGDEDFIKNGLKFHHLFGVLLYFDEVEGMKNFVITDHRCYLINLLKWLFFHMMLFSPTLKITMT